MSQVPASYSGSMFCGKRLSDQTVLENSKWTFAHSIKNQCFVNYQYLWPHLVIIPVLLLALLYIKTWGRIDRSPNYGKKYQLTFHLHTLRCSVFIVLILVQLLNFGEGIVTDLEIQSHLPTQPQLYLPPFLAILATAVVVLYYQKMEVWNKPSGLGFLLVYWLWSLIVEIARLTNLSYDDEFGIGVMRVLISITLTTIYVVLIGIECHVYGYKSRFGRNNLLKDLPNDLLDDNFQYLNEYSNLYSKRFLFWMKPFFDLSIKRALELMDLGNVPMSSQSQRQCERMEAEIQKQKQQDLDRGISKPTTRLIPILLNIYGWDMALAVIIRIVTSPLSVVTSLFIKGILIYINVIQHGGYTTMAHNATVEEFFRNGFVLAFCLGIVSLSLELLSNYGSTLLSHSVTPARSALQAVISQKGLRMSAGKLPKSDMEKKMTSNVMFEDMNNLLNGMTCLPTIFGTPCLVIFNTISLYQLLGPSSILALFIIILTNPLPGLIFKEYSKILSESMSRADERLKVTRETIAGIKVVKLFGWEDIFFGRIKAARDQQVSELRKGLVVGGLLIPGWAVGGTLATITALGMYSLFHGGRPLIPDVAFPALVLLASTAREVVSFPSVLRICVNANISIQRLQQYLNAPEVGNKLGKDSTTPVSKSPSEGDDAGAPEREPLLEQHYGTFSYSQLDKKPMYSEPALEEETEVIDVPDDVAIRIRDGSFTWNPDDVEPALYNINVDIPAGKFTMVIGEAGSGKSSLLSAMLGEIQTVRGEVTRSKNKSNAALVDQVPWIQNATLKDNIIFGNDEDERRYSEVVRCCGLRHDISILPAGDETKIGEEGINPSDEQKQRISIGRALYSKANIVFLDDPLSVLDLQVGDDLFEEGFQGLLREENRTIILVTHQLKHIEKADHIIMMKEGTIHVQGSPDLIEKEHPDMWQTWQEMRRTEIKEEEGEQEETERKAQEERLRLFRQISEHEKEEQMMFLISSLEEPDDDDSSEKVKMTQEVKTDTVEWSAYFYLIKMAGFLVVFTLIIAVLVLQVFETGAHFWLRNWSQIGLDSIEQGKGEYFPTRFYVIGYTLLAMGNIAFCFLVGFLVFWAALRVGVRLHTISLTSVIRSPLRFFDTTPSRQIMSRFSEGLHTIDHELGLQITVLIMTTIAVVNGIIINVILAGFFSVISLLPFLGFSFLVTKYYLMSIRDIKRLESMSLYPVYNHYDETLAGLRTIRAYAYQTQRSKESFQRIDQSAIVSLFKSSAGVWLAVQLALINNTMFTVLSCILIGMAKTGTLATSAVGLGLASIINSCSQFTTIVNNAAEVEMSMTAAERLSDYDNLPAEEYDGIVEPPAIWPDQGEIVMDGVWVRYDEKLDPVLKNVCLDVKPLEKIGISGGKGSGKSSLTLSFFRILDIFAGNIYIDGMNVKHIPLTQLRQKLAIVPQEPFLFTGSIRFNLDPFGTLTDEKLWEALEIAELKTVVEKLDGDLDAMVSEGGENFSVGQRQLFCLARAFLKDTKILIMDEATASIDMETLLVVDELSAKINKHLHGPHRGVQEIQILYYLPTMGDILKKIVASAFDERTVITVAHRAAMILGADRVVVMDDGRVVENDTPINLLQGNTLFTSLVQQKHDPVGIIIHSKECSCGH